MEFGLKFANFEAASKSKPQNSSLVPTKNRSIRYANYQFFYTNKSFIYLLPIAKKQSNQKQCNLSILLITFELHSFPRNPFLFCLENQ